MLRELKPKTKLDFNKIKSHTNNFLAIFSDDDPFVPLTDIDLFKNNDHYFGAWKDGDNVYFDVSVRHADKQQALKSAREHNQLAIFDVKNLESIYLEKGGDDNGKK